MNDALAQDQDHAAMREPSDARPAHRDITTNLPPSKNTCFAQSPRRPKRSTMFCWPQGNRERESSVNVAESRACNRLVACLFEGGHWLL